MGYIITKFIYNSINIIDDDMLILIELHRSLLIKHNCSNIIHNKQKHSWDLIVANIII